MAHLLEEEKCKKNTEVRETHGKSLLQKNEAVKNGVGNGELQKPGPSGVRFWTALGVFLSQLF